MFLGEYHHTIDEKLRLVIPAFYRKELGEEFIITKGIENCLYIYSLTEWEKIVANLENLSFTKKDVRIFTRSFFSGATKTSVDKQGRIAITPNQIKHASIKKECVIVGVGNRLEIWSQELWNQFLDDNNAKLSDIAENLFTGENI